MSHIVSWATERHTLVSEELVVWVMKHNIPTTLTHFHVRFHVGNIAIMFDNSHQVNDSVCTILVSDINMYVHITGKGHLSLNYM